MTIKVQLDTINHEDIQKVVDYYNQNKPEDQQPISRLPRYEGGFQIRLPDMKDIMCDENKGLCDATDLNAYFSNYWDNTTELEEKQYENNDQYKPDENTIVINIEEELAKHGDVSHDEDDFEKI